MLLRPIACRLLRKILGMVFLNRDEKSIPCLRTHISRDNRGRELDNWADTESSWLSSILINLFPNTLCCHCVLTWGSLSLQPCSSHNLTTNDMFSPPRTSSLHKSSIHSHYVRCKILEIIQLFEVITDIFLIVVDSWLTGTMGNIKSSDDIGSIKSNTRNVLCRTGNDYNF